jgi:hypothetical protein
MLSIIEKLVLNKKITKEDIYEELSRICDERHVFDNCSDECPVWKRMTEEEQRSVEKGYCPHATGEGMTKYIKQHS